MTNTDPLSETLARIGRDMAQQRRVAERCKSVGNYQDYHRLDQGRWAFYESARLICQYFGRDFEAWLTEWEAGDVTNTERQALYTSCCVLCGHALIDHHTASLRCQYATKSHWWSRRVQCPCEMRPS